MIELPKPETKREALFQGFVLLFQSCQFPQLATPDQRKELIKMIQAILEDPDITVEVAQACCDRAVMF